MSHSLPYEFERHDEAQSHAVEVTVDPALRDRNRLTTAFRIILAIPQLVLVGGPAALGISLLWPPDSDQMNWAAGGGVLGAVALFIAVIGWFAIVFTGRMPEGLWDLSTFYLRWRVRASAYAALLRDEYPPFGEGVYPAELMLTHPPADRNRITVAFRLVLAIPHLVVLWLLGVAWMLTTVIAWFAILFTGNYPRGLYHFAVGVLRWSTNVEAYVLLLHDEFPPFSFANHQ